MIDVLWLEDQPTLLRDFKILAGQKGLQLINVLTAEQAIEQLKKSKRFDAAVLDARGYQRSTEERAGTPGMHKVRDKLNANGNIPFAIFSGEASIMENQEFKDAIGSTPLFEKGRDEEALIEWILNAVSDNDRVRIKRQYDSSFKVFRTEKLYDFLDEKTIEDAKEYLMQLLLFRLDLDKVSQNIRHLYEDFIFPIFEYYLYIPEVDNWGREITTFNQKAIELQRCGKNSPMWKRHYGNVLSMTAINSQPLNHGYKDNELKQVLTEVGSTNYTNCLVEGMLAIMDWLPVFLNQVGH